MSRGLVLLALVLTSCGHPVPPVFVDPVLGPYINKYCALLGKDCSQIEVSFVKLPFSVIGECITDENDNRSIQVDPDFWTRVTQNANEKEALLLHELGHCVLGLGHNNRRLFDGCPASIMYPIDFGGTPCYREHRGEYLAALSRGEG